MVKRKGTPSAADEEDGRHVFLFACSLDDGMVDVLMMFCMIFLVLTSPLILSSFGRLLVV